MFARLRERLAFLRGTPLHPQWLMFRGEAAWYRQIGSLAQGRVIDVGCGMQRVRAFLPPDADYVTLDHPAIGAERYGSRPRVLGDATALPFGDATADSLLMLEVLEHVPDARTALAEAARVLRPGGRLMLSVPFLYPIHDAPFDFRRWTRHGLEQAAARHGFTAERLAPYASGPELAALMANLTLSRLVLRLAGRGNPLALPLLPLAVVAVPLANLLGWLLGLLDRGDDMAACGYRCVFVKPLAASRP